MSREICKLDNIKKNAVVALEIIQNKENKNKVKYLLFKDEREKNIKKIKECHNDIMKEITEKIENTGDEHTDNNEIYEKVKKFESTIVENLSNESKLIKTEENSNKAEDEYEALLKDNFNIEKEIEHYKTRSDKINSDLEANEEVLENNYKKMVTLYIGNIGIFIFIIISLIYINFKKFFIRNTSKISKKQTNLLFDINNNKIKHQSILDNR
jgi:hypothetical protein